MLLLLRTPAIYAVPAIAGVTCTCKAPKSVITVRIIATIVQAKRTFINICNGYLSKIILVKRFRMVDFLV